MEEKWPIGHDRKTEQDTQQEVIVDRNYHIPHQDTCHTYKEDGIQVSTEGSDIFLWERYQHSLIDGWGGEENKAPVWINSIQIG